MIRKLLICPWFGPLPEWMPLWERNVATLEQYGYDVLREHDLDAFKQRVADIIGIDCPIVEGEGKIHDYRCAFGLLYEQELAGYDYWGHTDFDCVYGRVGAFLSDNFLRPIDIFSNHVDYVSGPWSLYRNDPFMARLFKKHPDWQEILENPETTGWVETGFTEIVDEAHAEKFLVRRYANWQTANLDDFSTVWLAENGRLFEGRREIMLAHFRRTKEYPEGCQ